MLSKLRIIIKRIGSLVFLKREEHYKTSTCARGMHVKGEKRYTRLSSLEPSGERQKQSSKVYLPQIII